MSPGRIEAIAQLNAALNVRKHYEPRDLMDVTVQIHGAQNAIMMGLLELLDPDFSDPVTRSWT